MTVHRKEKPCDQKQRVSGKSQEIQPKHTEKSGARNNYPNDNYNQNKHFLGQQQNTTDWPTLREAELFSILRTFFLQEGPVRG